MEVDGAANVVVDGAMVEAGVVSEVGAGTCMYCSFSAVNVLMRSCVSIVKNVCCVFCVFPGSVVV